jgi:hypothetical protein
MHMIRKLHVPRNVWDDKQNSKTTSGKDIKLKFYEVMVDSTRLNESETRLKKDRNVCKSKAAEMGLCKTFQVIY